ncbi:hypothetical protein Aasi_0837 [Candidatus Amoebophilus asiaticus 5a2]|uniref:DUF1761 domain-containing protein n=1 Tax=Amoebophilus asiaticus (strain 5a2) TaxID=452471 RepID=B3ESK6_AMOA5|nr:DUF1761 domain-containing protein [Candidatus Amoebophilus asiaticus]ACE06208.1 hypothetical protein Aasi_0837 [Candidatus Amoebophilus asiaticus 5a2]
MINLFSAINWISVLIAFVAYFLLGALWFTLLFKKQYAHSLGKENDTLQNSSPIFFIGPAVCSLVITITSAILIDALGIDSYGKAIEFAFVIGIGYLFTNTVNIAINPNIPKPILYGIISGMFHLIGILIVSVVIVAMR